MLSMSLPSSAHVPADTLALALASRRELVREWLVGPSMGSLPERQLAGRIIERAARIDGESIAGAQRNRPAPKPSDPDLRALQVQQ